MPTPRVSAHPATSRTGVRRQSLAGALAFAAAALAACGQASPSTIGDGAQGPIVSPLPEGPNTTVKRVVDGDTFVISNGDRIRLIGIDTPESVKPDSPIECYGPEASQRTKSLLPAGTEVRLEFDRDRADRFGRTLAYVFRRSDGLFVNASLLADGFATTLSIAPNTLYADRFSDLQKQAKRQKVGLWGSCKR